jgi:hypothetical protein
MGMSTAKPTIKYKETPEGTIRNQESGNIHDPQAAWLQQSVANKITGRVASCRQACNHNASLISPGHGQNKKTDRRKVRYGIQIF